MTTREANLVKKMLPCPKCGTPFLTDRFHRFHAKCRANSDEGRPVTHVLLPRRRLV